MAVPITAGAGYIGSATVELLTAHLTGKVIKISNENRRPGDPSRLVADGGKAREVLNWQAQHSDIANIISTSWDWHPAHPDGYAAE
jgi:UDP-glucose 4-epimerase